MQTVTENLSKEELQKVLNIQKKYPNKKLIEILFEYNFISKEIFLKELAKDLNIDYILSFENISIPSIKIPANILKQLNSIPVKIENSTITIATTNPTDWNIKNYFQRMFPNYTLNFIIADKNDILKAIKKLEYHQIIENLQAEVKKELKGQQSINQSSAVMNLINHIIKTAIDKKASDIHIEAEENFFIIRLRILGELYEYWNLQPEIATALISRIKLEANMDVSEKRKPQDGSFILRYQNETFNFRIATLPTVWGESLVIRILDKRNIIKNLEEIGMSEKNLLLLKKALKKPNGIFLVTGPTGSGKSTTLYASLYEITSINKKIITIEDPVEYKLKGIQQVNINPKINLTFANILRNILRHDPDIIMIGEIRDKETLEIAIKAALSGHLVLSTLHTNDSVSAIDRMINMGAENYMISAALIGVEAQRLVKTNCPYCLQPYKPNDNYLEQIKDFIPKETTFYKGKGCEKCNMTGFAGRTLISEIFLNDENLERMIAKNKTHNEIKQYLISNGFKSMFYDGVLKAINKITTLEEVFKVVI